VRVITGALARNVFGAWGDDGARWLADLPRVLEGVARDWALDVGAPYEMSYHHVAAVTCAGGTPAVLKLGVPSGGSLRDEVPALAAFGGRGAVRLLRADLDRGALLLERAEPGWRARDLVPARDAEATSAVVGVMRRLHAPPPPGCGMPDLLTLAVAFDEYLAVHRDGGPLPRYMVARAGGLMRELCASATGRVVLHGDLQYLHCARQLSELPLSVLTLAAAGGGGGSVVHWDMPWLTSTESRRHSRRRTTSWPFSFTACSMEWRPSNIESISKTAAGPL
jgi:streptomycin 6-kinase